MEKLKKKKEKFNSQCIYNLEKKFCQKAFITYSSLYNCTEIWNYWKISPLKKFFLQMKIAFQKEKKINETKKEFHYNNNRIIFEFASQPEEIFWENYMTKINLKNIFIEIAIYFSLLIILFVNFITLYSIFHLITENHLSVSLIIYL